MACEGENSRGLIWRVREIIPEVCRPEEIFFCDLSE